MVIDKDSDFIYNFVINLRNGVASATHDEK